MKYWEVRITNDDETNDYESHFFKTESGARMFFNDMRRKWKTSEHTAKYKEYGSDEVIRGYMFIGYKNSLHYINETLTIKEKEMNFED